MTSVLCNVRIISVFVVSISVVATISPVWAQWENSVIDTITDTQVRKETQLQSLDIDSLDCVHIVWKHIRSNGWRIFYSTNSPSGVWLSPEEVGDSSQACFSPGLEVCPFSNKPYIVFEQNAEIVVAYRSASVWQRHFVTSNTQVDISPTIAVDNQGLVHLAWITEDSGSGEYKIAYALGDSINWGIQILVGSELGPYGTGAVPYIAVSPSGIAHIVYRGGDYGSYHVHHAWNDSLGGGNWSYETLISGNANDFSSAMAIEADGDLHLAVSGNDGWGFPGRVYYFYQPHNQSWEPSELASLTYSASEPSIDFDEYGFPHIVWMETSGNMYTGYMFYSCKMQGAWQVSLVIADDYFVPSFKIDRAGYGHIGCHTGGNTGIYDIYHIRSGEKLAVLEYPVRDKHYGSYDLAQNYPNPSRHHTTISYYTPASLVTLKVYNIVGEEVAVLVNEYQAEGHHQVTWDTSGIDAGVYFYCVQAGAFTQTKKCLILK